MNNKDPLELFLKLHSVLIDKEINSCEERTLKNVFIAEKELVISLVEFVKYITTTDKDKLQSELNEILETSENHLINVDEIKRGALLYAENKRGEESDRG